MSKDVIRTQYLSDAPVLRKEIEGLSPGKRTNIGIGNCIDTNSAMQDVDSRCSIKFVKSRRNMESCLLKLSNRAIRIGKVNNPSPRKKIRYDVIS
jgi:hypothetical protein